MSLRNQKDLEQPRLKEREQPGGAEANGPRRQGSVRMNQPRTTSNMRELRSRFRFGKRGRRRTCPGHVPGVTRPGSRARVTRRGHAPGSHTQVTWASAGERKAQRWTPREAACGRGVDVPPPQENQSAGLAK